ncbi:MAG TPA: hypothetical protein VK459_24365 [Polyangiaceae bacterium]|jgi:hypothetical protein|nr:hypothetical protein [Polyangiaceae bacterium]
MANGSVEGNKPTGEQDPAQTQDPMPDAVKERGEKGDAPPEEGGPDRGSGGAALQRPPSDS